MIFVQRGLRFASKWRFMLWLTWDDMTMDLRTPWFAFALHYAAIAPLEQVLLYGAQLSYKRVPNWKEGMYWFAHQEFVGWKLRSEDVQGRPRW